MLKKEAKTNNENKYKNIYLCVNNGKLVKRLILKDYYYR